MAHNKDFVPGADAQFGIWLENLTGYVDAMLAAGTWTHIPPDKGTVLKQRRADWRTAYGRTRGPHTSVDTEAKNDARQAAEGFVRPFIRQYLKFDPVTNEDRTAMRLPNKRPAHIIAGDPKTRALITGLKVLGGFQIGVRFQDEAAPDSRAIPYGMNGALLNYAWGPEKITDYARIKEIALMTRSPFTLSLPPEAEGKFLSCFARWQNARGELGKWGEIQHTVIA